GNLERLKSTLLPMLNTISLVMKIARKKADTEEIEEQRNLIESFIMTNQQTEQKLNLLLVDAADDVSP
ncbi:hypothetical protein LTS18_007230, partial [Coniosporium uncinatum]